MKQDLNQRQKALNDSIKAGEFKPAYLLCGEQAYLRIQNRDKLLRALLPEEDLGESMNLTRFSGKETTAAAVIDMAETLPFFADRRVILLEETEMFGKNSGEGDILADYLPRLPETTVLVFAEREADKRKRLCKAVAKAGLVFECDTPDERTLNAWAASLFRKAGFGIDRKVLALFLSRTGEDMLNIVSEADKLTGYCMGRPEITEEDVRTLTTPLIRDRIFEMIEAISARDRDRSLGIYLELCEIRTAPQAILSLMERQLNQLLQVKEGLGKIPDRELAQKIGIPPFVLTKKYKPVVGSYSAAELLASLEECLQADQDYKSGKIDAQAAVELILVRRTEKKETGGIDSSLQNRTARWDRAGRQRG